MTQLTQKSEIQKKTIILNYENPTYKTSLYDFNRCNNNVIRMECIHFPTSMMLSNLKKSHILPILQPSPFSLFYYSHYETRQIPLPPFNCFCANK